MADSEEPNAERDSGGQPPLIRFDSPWAWFYYITFGIQVLVATYFAAESEISAAVSNSPPEIYTLIMKVVSSQVPAMAAYSLIIAATAEGLRMIAERYLARRFAEGKEEGKKQGRAEGREQGRAEGKEQGRVEGREQGRVESFEELARWLDANPAIKEAIESGEANPPPFLDGSQGQAKVPSPSTGEG